MKKIIVVTILLLGVGLVVFAQPQQLPPEEVHISATVPYGVVDFPPPVITSPPETPEAPPVQVINLRDTSVEITWYTIEKSNSIVEYGQTPAYGITVVDWALVKYHQVKLTDLKPKTLYYFRVKSRTDVGKESISLGYTFKTLDLTPPANVSNFLATPGDRMITLTWLNPPDEDFTGVKIQMSTTIYPSSPTEGTTVYDGKGETVEVRPLQNGARYYFTAFAYDDSQNYASGAISSAVPTVEVVPPEVIPFIPPELVPKIAEITFQDFIFSIEGVEIFPVEGVVEVGPLQTFKISIPVEKFPKVLKTIITVVGERTSSYLLRINEEETAYEAIITAPQEPGLYPMTTIIMDFKEGTVAKIEAKLKVVAPSEEAVLPIAEVEKEKPSWTPLLVLISIILIIGAIIGYLIGKVRRKITI